MRAVFSLVVLLCSAVMFGQADRISSLQVFMELPTQVGGNPEDIFLEGQAMHYTVVAELTSLIDLDSIHIALGEDSLSTLSLDQSFAIDGSNLSPTQSIEQVDEFLYVKIGTFPLFDPLYCRVYGVLSDGNVTNTVAPID